VSGRFEPVVLCYHAVSERWEDELAVRPETLVRQIELLLGRGHRAASASEVAVGRGRLLHVTFDDAFRGIVDVVPALERLGVPATVFACSGLAEGGLAFCAFDRAHAVPPSDDELRTQDWDGLRALAERGVEIGSHTVSHPHLTELAESELDRELRESRERVESELGRPCRFLAFPYGEHDARVRAATQRAGYEAAFALPGTSKPFDRFGIPRIGVWRKDGWTRFTLKTSAARRPIGALRRWR
jgi:peptidoglycan/xylan/chitin deacetylase (PgdA/CDA1 family)